MKRQSWHQYFMAIAKTVSTRSTCLRRQIGAVVVRDNQILSTGYNGSASGLEHCLDVGCIRDELNIPSGTDLSTCRAAHAEMNAICKAAKHGVPINDATLYTTTFPCSMCSKLIVNSGIKVIYYEEGYPDVFSLDILKNISILQFISK